MRKMAVQALILISLSRLAAADHFHLDVKTLDGWCRPYKVGSESLGSLCEGYLNAILDILAHGVPVHNSRACIPDHVELGELRDLVIEALKVAPKPGSEVAHDWVAKAISEAFPCEDSGN
jgi:hypothetical protein